MTETAIQARVLRDLGSRPDVRLFRNEVGVGWVGKMIRRGPTTVTLLHPSRVTFGLHPGSSDLIGWHTVRVTPEMLGSLVAVFLGVEVKSASGTVKPHQAIWHHAIQKAGGCSILARGTHNGEFTLSENVL